jgi:hypothetical protein
MWFGSGVVSSVAVAGFGYLASYYTAGRLGDMEKLDTIESGEFVKDTNFSASLRTRARFCRNSARALALGTLIIFVYGMLSVRDAVLTLK